ncbi:MAG: TrmH family RNA methyltransferase [Filomicrobium sp.]
MRLALFQPDIPQNTGTILRMGACLGVPIDVIGPAGFDMSERALKRAGLDYLETVELCRHVGFDSFDDWRRSTGHRLVLASTRGYSAYCDFGFSNNDILMMGRESVGVPDDVRARVDAAVFIPIRSGTRSLNVAMASAMILGEALRQTGGIQDK